MSTEIDDIRKAWVTYRNANKQSTTFKKAEAFLLMVRNKYGTANPNEIENLLK